MFPSCETLPTKVNRCIAKIALGGKIVFLPPTEDSTDLIMEIVVKQKEKQS